MQTWSIKAGGATIAGVLGVLALLISQQPAQAAVQIFALGGVASMQQGSVLTVPAAQGDSVAGGPMLGAVKVEAILAAYHSPMAGDGQYIEDLSQQYQVSDGFALADWIHEDGLGGNPAALIAIDGHNPGNLRYGELSGWHNPFSGFAMFGSWREGEENWFALIRHGYLDGQETVARTNCMRLYGHNCTTIPEIISVYAPSSDHNDPSGYASAVEAQIAQWQKG